MSNGGRPQANLAAPDPALAPLLPLNINLWPLRRRTHGSAPAAVQTIRSRPSLGLNASRTFSSQGWTTRRGVQLAGSSRRDDSMCEGEAPWPGHMEAGVPAGIPRSPQVQTPPRR